MPFEHDSEIHRLLKLGAHAPVVPGAPESLPVPAPKLVAPSPSGAVALDQDFVESLKNLMAEKPKTIWSFLLYPLIFLAAFAFFYLLLNFSAVTAQVKGWFTKPQAQVILGDSMSQYNSWISGYFYSVSDPTLLDPNNDIDHDGLSNYDEFIMHTNPTVADSDGDGFSDGVEVINSDNPWGSGPMTTQQKQLAADLNMITINNRITYNALAKNGLVSGTSTIKYDTSKPGTLSIPRLNLTVPLIWSQDPADFENDLTKGVIHYPGTAMPGEQGTVYVSGHSSDYIWKHDPMQSIFAKLNFLKPGDDVFVDVYDLSGKVHNFRYQVSNSQIYKPDDQTQFIDNSSNKLNLSTCWPIGTSTNRLVVSAVQVGF